MATVYVCSDEPAPVAPGDCIAWQAQSYEPSPFLLSVADASAIGGAIAVLWAAAYGVRLLVRFFRSFN